MSDKKKIVELEHQLKLCKGLLDESEKMRRQALDVVHKFKDILECSVRVEEVSFNGKRGCQFVFGRDHVVAEWRGDGVSIDRVFVEKPSLEYGETTTPFIRCLRMAFEMAHWPILCAMVAGVGDGELRELKSEEL